MSSEGQDDGTRGASAAATVLLDEPPAGMKRDGLDAVKGGVEEPSSGADAAGKFAEIDRHTRASSSSLGVSSEDTAATKKDCAEGVVPLPCKTAPVVDLLVEMKTCRLLCLVIVE